MDMNRKRVCVLGVGCGSVLVAGAVWWTWPKISDLVWEISEPIEAPMEWNLGESRAHYTVSKDGQGRTLLIVSDTMLKGEIPLSIKEADQILDNCGSVRMKLQRCSRFDWQIRI